MALMLKQCGICKKRFKTTYHAKKYCSMPCKLEGYYYHSRLLDKKYDEAIRQWKKRHPEKVKEMYERVRKRVYAELHKRRKE